MESRTKIFYINIILLITIVSIVVVLMSQLFFNKEFDKTYWTYKIGASNEKNLNNQITIINIQFKHTNITYNTENIHNEMTYQKGFQLFNNMDLKEEDNDYHSYQRRLFPDSLSIDYFSLDELNFINTKKQSPIVRF